MPKSTIYSVLSEESLTVNSVSNASAAITEPGTYRLFTDQTCHVKVGLSPTATHAHFPVFMNEDVLLSVGESEQVAVLSHSATNQPWSVGIREDDSASSFKDYTSKLNSDTVNDVIFFPAGAGVDDAFYFGADKKFAQIILDIGTPGAGTYTLSWEYWDGTAWTALAGISDGTTDFKAAAGENIVSYTLPTDWGRTDIYIGIHLYFIRAKRDGGTVTTNPLGTKALPLTPVGEAWLSRVGLS